MAPIKKDTPLKSPLVSAFNNIVNINRAGSQMRSTRKSYDEFLRFMTLEVTNIQAIKLPDEKKIKKLSNINVSSTFGSAGSLLSSLASGALDAAGLVGDFFGGGSREKTKPKAGKTIPKSKGIRLAGVRGLPILSAALAGLDFAQGISQGESTGQAGAGALGSAAGAAGGALAGSALAGAIGQTLVPIPGLGFVLGTAVGSLGSFAGGWLADRAYEKATGDGGVKEKTKARLKEQEQKQKTAAAISTSTTFPEVMNKFDSVVTQFEVASKNMSLGADEYYGEWEMGETAEDEIDYRPKDAEEFVPAAPTGSGDEVFPLVGGKPTFTMGAGVFNAMRDGGARKHSAQDIGVDPNTPVVSSRSGKVINIYPTYGSAGSAVIVRYDNGQQGLYGHVDPNVKVGDNVKAGQKIAKVTPDGQNTHLHYMRKDTRGNYIDPLPLLQKSKSGVPIVKGEKQESKKDLQQQSQFGQNTGDTMVSQKSKAIPTTSAPKTTDPSPEMVKNFETAWQYRNNPIARGRIESAWGSMSSEQKQQAMTWAESKGYDWKEMKLPTPVTSSQVQSMMQQPTTPRQIETYPDYNLPQSSVTLMPIIMGGSGGSSQQRPIVIAGSGGGGGTTIMPPIPEGQVLNSLFKTILLTNLSGT